MASTPPPITTSPIQDSFVKLYDKISDLGPIADYCSQILQDVVHMMWPQVDSLDLFGFRILNLGHSAHYEHDALETKLIGYVHGDASEPDAASPQPSTNKYAAMLEVRLARQYDSTRYMVFLPLAVGETYQLTEVMTYEDMIIMITGLLESLEMLAISADTEVLKALGNMAFAGTKVICFDAHVASKVGEAGLGSAHVIVPSVDCGTQKVAVLMGPAIDVDPS